jgi:hypothetical protein
VRDAAIDYLVDPQTLVDTFIDNSFLAFTALALLKLLYAYTSVPVFLALTALSVVLILLLYSLDRSLLFLYRKILTDDLLSTILALLIFVTTTIFITLFLLTQGTLDGFMGAKNVGSYLHSEASNSEALSVHWDSAITAVNDAAVGAYSTLATTYSNATWFPTINETIAPWFVNDTFVLLLESDDASGMAESCDMNAIGDSCVADASESSSPNFFASTIDFKALKHQLVNLDISTDQVSAYLNVAVATAGGGAAMLSDTLNILTNIIDNISDAIIKVVMFLTFLILLLQTPSDILTTLIVELTPTTSLSTKLAISTALRESLMGVLMMPLRLASARSCCMVIFLTAGGGYHVFFSALLCFLHAVAPVAPSYLICLPWVIVWFAQGRYVTAVLVLVAIKSSIGYTDDRLFTMHSSNINPLFTSLSILMGYKAFGFQGVLLGPLCLTLMNLMRVGVSVAEMFNLEGRESFGAGEVGVGGSKKRAVGLQDMLFGNSE